MRKSSEFNDYFDVMLQNMRDTNPHIRVFAHLIVRAVFGFLSGAEQIKAAHKMLEASGLTQLSTTDAILTKKEALDKVCVLPAVR